MEQRIEPDVIVHATSSAGTQAGLVAGCALLGLDAEVIGVSADDSAEQIEAAVRRLLHGLGALLDVNGETLMRDAAVNVDDGQVGGGYGVATAASREAIELVARTEGLFLDPTYTAKAMAASSRGLGATLQFPVNGAFLAHGRPGRVVRLSIQGMQRQLRAAVALRIRSPQQVSSREVEHRLPEMLDEQRECVTACRDVGYSINSNGLPALLQLVSELHRILHVHVVVNRSVDEQQPPPAGSLGPQNGGASKVTLRDCSEANPSAAPYRWCRSRASR